MKRFDSNMTTVVVFRVAAIIIAISVVLVRSANLVEGAPDDVNCTHDDHIFHRILRFRIPSIRPISKSSKTTVEGKSIKMLGSDKGESYLRQTIPVEPTDNRLETESTENRPTANVVSVASTENPAGRTAIAPDQDENVDTAAKTQSAGTGSATLDIAADAKPLPAAEAIQESRLMAVVDKQGSDGGDVSEVLAVDTSTELNETQEQETKPSVTEHSKDSPAPIEVKESRPPATNSMKLVQKNASPTPDKPADKLTVKLERLDPRLPQSLIRKMLAVDVTFVQRPAFSSQPHVGSDDDRKAIDLATSVEKVRSEEQVADRSTPITDTPVGTDNDDPGPTNVPLTTPLEPPLPRAISVRDSRGSSSMTLRFTGGTGNSAVAVQRPVPATSPATAAPVDSPARTSAALATRPYQHVKSTINRPGANSQGLRAPSVLTRPSTQKLATSQALISRLKSRPVDMASPSSTSATTAATRRTPQPAETKSQPATELAQRHPAPPTTRSVNERRGQNNSSTSVAVRARTTVSRERSGPVQSPGVSSLAVRSWTVARPQAEPALSPIRKPSVPKQVTSNPDPAATVAKQWIHAQPRVRYPVRVSNEIVELAGKHNEYARSLASKGAVLTAQDEYVQTLRLIAQAKDAVAKSERHRQSLTEALVTFKEADDFAAALAVVTTDSDVKRFISDHRSPVFKQTTRERISAFEALQTYYSFVVNRLSMSLGNDRVASDALCGLAQLQSFQFGTVHTEPTMGAAKSIVLFQASLAADATNSLAANELGVIYTRYGRLEQAKDAFLQSTLGSNQPEPWANLSTVYERLGNQQLARQAIDRYHAIKQAGQDEEIQITGVKIHWVNHHAFGVRTDSMRLNNTSQQPTKLSVQKNANPRPQVQSPVVGRKTGALRSFVNSFRPQQRGAEPERPAYTAKQSSITKHSASRR